MSAYDQAFAFVVSSEGSTLDLTRSDRGNWTGGAVGRGELRGSKFGVSAAQYPTLDIAALTLDDAKAIYRRDYWSRIRGDELPPPIALVVFDAAVNSGPGRAVEWLQLAIGAHNDMVFGDMTMSALNLALKPKGGGAKVCAEMLARRLVFMAQSPEWPGNALGWARRVTALAYASTAIAINGGT